MEMQGETAGCMEMGAWKDPLPRLPIAEVGLAVEVGAALPDKDGDVGGLGADKPVPGGANVLLTGLSPALILIGAGTEFNDENDAERRIELRDGLCC